MGIKRLFLLHILFFVFFFFELHSLLVDLEKDRQDFVIETKKIEIPGFPFAFNVGITKWNNCNLMSFRDIPNPKKSFESNLGLVIVDDDFFPISKPQLIELRFESMIPCRAEDARLIVVGEKLYMVYSDNGEPAISKGGFRVYLCEILYLDGHFYAENIRCLLDFDGENRNIREKNWVPFEYEENLFLAYSILPHRILKPLLETNICETICSTLSKISWKWGDLRGGTPALPINQESYLSFFHSSIPMTTVHSKGKNISHYFIGAYLFSRIPPFTITHVSQTPIIGKNFYHGEMYKPYWKEICAVFPCGFIQDDQYIWIVYGRQDHEAWVAKLDKEQFLNSLVSVEKE